MDLICSLGPIVILIYLMTKSQPLPASRALPLAAGLVYLIKLGYFGSDPNLVHATVAVGLLTAATPILIVWGAIFLFKTMEHTGALDTIRTWLNGLTENRVAQLMLVGWSFAFLIEGASGFGTPAALAAPILASLGFPPVRAVLFCLVMNSVPVSFGAVGTPTWFGLSEVALTAEQLRQVGFQSALIHCAAALVVPPLTLLFLVPGREIRANLGFVYLAIVSAVGPMLLLARFDYEFPSLVGGLVGLGVAAVAARRGWGLAPTAAAVRPELPAGALWRAGFPLWGTVLVLALTRVKQLGLKGLLNLDTPAWHLQLGSLGEFGVSPALVLQLKHVFGTSAAWSHKLLYVPSLIPFFLVAGLSLLWLGTPPGGARAAWRESWERLREPILALLGALVFVKLLMMDGERSAAMTIGRSLASATGPAWLYVASYLGAVGAFFAGSNTVSNLTFAGIQDSIAQGLHLPRLTVLALQSAGGAMGNMVCINNIVAACSVLGLTGLEGYILKRTAPLMLLYGLVAALVGGVLAWTAAG